MTDIPLANLSSSQLKEIFIEKSIKQDNADLRDEIDVWNKIYLELKILTEELKHREGDHRKILIPLYRHKNSQVRVNAAIATLFVAPAAAREALEWIAKWDVGSQRTEAIGMISALDSGRFVPA